MSTARTPMTGIGKEILSFDGNNLLLTGRPGIGKTTIVEKVVDLLPQCEGFYTTEVRKSGERVGFLIRSLSGKQALLATRQKTGYPRVGRYVVNMASIDDVAVSSINAGVESGVPVIVDEIGKMEILSPSFRKAVSAALDSAVPVLATISMARGDFFDTIRKRSDVKIIVVNHSNRNDLPAILANAILAIKERGGQK